MTIDPNLVPERGKSSTRESDCWCGPELLRIQGERLLKGAVRDAESRAETLFLQAVETSRLQGTLGWQLRAATSLAALWQRNRQLEQARQVLSTTLGSIRQDHDSRDMVIARELLARLS
jgi:hypothetical protein